MVTAAKLPEAATASNEVIVECIAQNEDVAKETAIPTASSEAAPVTSKRAGKKSKKASKTEGSSGDADAESNSNIAATIDHPYLSFLHKRIRLYKKKLEKIKALAAAQINDGKVLNDQQHELVSSKALVEKMITEFETLREQFIEVFVKEEAEKRVAEKTAAAAPEATPVIGEIKKEEIKKEEIVTAEVAKEKIEKEEDVVPRDAFAYVEDLLRTLHAVTLHQALGEDVPMVLDYFSKVLLGTTRPPAEVPFEENLAESLEEATRYLTKSNKPVVMDVTYQDLRVMVEKLGAPVRTAVEEAAVEETVEEVKAPTAEELPHINFFTDSLLENAADTATEDTAADKPHAVPAAETAVPVEEEQPQAQGETKASVVDPGVKKPRSRKPNAAATGSGDEKPPPRRRSQNRSKNHSNENSPRGTGQATTVEGGKADVSSNGASKPRRSRGPRSNDENGGSSTANRAATASGGKPERPRTDRPARKPQHKEAVQA